MEWPYLSVEHFSHTLTVFPSSLCLFSFFIAFLVSNYIGFDCAIKECRLRHSPPHYELCNIDHLPHVHAFPLGEFLCPGSWGHFGWLHRRSACLFIWMSVPELGMHLLYLNSSQCLTLYICASTLTYILRIPISVNVRMRVENKRNYQLLPSPLLFLFLHHLLFVFLLIVSFKHMLWTELSLVCTLQLFARDFQHLFSIVSFYTCFFTDFTNAT